MSETMKKTIYTQLHEAYDKFPKILKDSKNPHFKSSYAGLPSVLEAVRPVLNEVGIIFYSTIDRDVPDVLKLTLYHVHSDTFIESYMPLKNAVDMQKHGGSMTYAQRYGLLAMLSLAAEDDDGNTACQPSKVFKKPVQQAQTAVKQQFETYDPKGTESFDERKTFEDNFDKLWSMKRAAAFKQSPRRGEQIDEIVKNKFQKEDTDGWQLISTTSLKPMFDWLSGL